MLRSIIKLVFLASLVLAGGVAIFVYRAQFSADREIQQLQKDKHELQQIVQRLTDERRVADMLVTDQKIVDGVPTTTLLFVEYARDGSSLPPRVLTYTGELAHFDAMVIKFDHDFVQKDDPLRGHSIALFTRVYGDRQQPSQGATIDETGKVPDYYRGNDPKTSAFEMSLWTDFWKLVEDPAYRQHMGVRVANGQGLWGPLHPGRLYTITMEADGGLNLSSEPQKEIYREAMKRRGAL